MDVRSLKVGTAAVVSASANAESNDHHPHRNKAMKLVLHIMLRDRIPKSLLELLGHVDNFIDAERIARLLQSCRYKHCGSRSSSCLQVIEWGKRGITIYEEAAGMDD